MDNRHPKRGSLDYDLFVIDPTNQDSTPEQIRDCIYDALCVLSKEIGNG